MLNSSPWSIVKTLLTVMIVAAPGMLFLSSSSLALDLGEPLEGVEKLESKLKLLTEQDIADKVTSIAQRYDGTNPPQWSGELCWQERTPPIGRR